MYTFLIIFSIYSFGVLLTLSLFPLFLWYDNTLANAYEELGQPYEVEEIDLHSLFSEFCLYCLTSYGAVIVLIYEIIKMHKELKNLNKNED
jgi:hypothetical protein